MRSRYCYGFNGKENDGEVKGDGNQQDYGMRVYDPRLGRFLSVDPLTRDYPWYTPYQFSRNKPIRYIDLDGMEEASQVFYTKTFLKMFYYVFTGEDHSYDVDKAAYDLGNIRLRTALERREYISQAGSNLGFSLLGFLGTANSIASFGIYNPTAASLGITGSAADYYEGGKMVSGAASVAVGFGGGGGFSSSFALARGAQTVVTTAAQAEVKIAAVVMASGQKTPEEARNTNHKGFSSGKLQEHYEKHVVTQQELAKLHRINI